MWREKTDGQKKEGKTKCKEQRNRSEKLRTQER